MSAAMTPPSISEEEIWDLLNAAWPRMSPHQQRIWDVVRILPEKWNQTPYGDHCDGFWAVGIFGTRVIWYNELEDGFNLSRYSRYGTIDEYWCNQDKLEHTIQNILNELSGAGASPSVQPPWPKASAS